MRTYTHLHAIARRVRQDLNTYTRIYKTLFRKRISLKAPLSPHPTQIQGVEKGCPRFDCNENPSPSLINLTYAARTTPPRSAQWSYHQEPITVLSPQPYLVLEQLPPWARNKSSIHQSTVLPVSGFQ